MSEREVIGITRRLISRLGDLSSGTEYRIEVKTRYDGYILEVEDAHFHHDSAVLMPDYGDPTPPDDKAADANKVTGLAALMACYEHARKHPDQKTLVVGHTDRSGPTNYNQTLSELRAKNVLFALQGKRSAWADVADRKHQVEDYQQILRWLTITQGWSCDPGPKDNKNGPKTTAGVKAFQAEYKERFAKKLKVDGIVGPQTWGAVFDVYMRELAELIGTNEKGMAEARTQLDFMACPSIGCGEHHPITDDRASNYESKIDRRVEVLFFDPGEEPLVDCKRPRGACTELYGKSMYTFVPIKRKPASKKDKTRNIRISKVDDHFAPKHETLDVTYDINGIRSETVRLEITSAHYREGPLFKRELTADEKADGSHTVEWDGLCTCDKGSLKDRYLHPLFGPYTVRLSCGPAIADEAMFNVLYHSIALQPGPWTPDEAEPDESDEKAWVQYKLNELGYFGGPVGKDVDKYLSKAIIRYKFNHASMHELKYSKYKKTITQELKTALKAGDNKREYVSSDDYADEAKTIRIRVEALTYEDGEFGKSKAKKEAERLSRPLIPLEAAVQLKAKDDSAVAVPEATGPVRVNWRIEDPNENLADQVGNTATEPSRTRAYVEKCLKLKKGRTGDNGDNCPKQFGGIRDAASKNWRHPFLLGKYYRPYDVKKDGKRKAVFSLASDDPGSFPKRLGKAGVFFRPSNIAGDDYRVVAEIDFKGLPNQSELEKLHNVTDQPSRIHARSGLFQIWRFNQVAMTVTWPKRTNSNEWDKVKKEFEVAYLDLDVANIDEKKISDVLSEAEYQEIVRKNTAHKDVSKISLNDAYLVGVALPAQGSLNASAYRSALNTFTNDNYWDKIVYPLRRKLSENIRKTHPSGFVAVEFLTHKPVDVQKAPPGDTSVVRAAYVSWTFSIGLPDSVIFADQKDPDKVYFVVGHEMGHNFWLKHWEHAGGSRAKDHDRNDHNCLMSYSSQSCSHAHHRQGVYTPHFCGQCNLKLRGWDVDKRALPARS